MLADAQLLPEDKANYDEWLHMLPVHIRSTHKEEKLQAWFVEADKPRVPLRRLRRTRPTDSPAQGMEAALRGGSPLIIDWSFKHLCDSDAPQLGKNLLTTSSRLTRLDLFSNKLGDATCDEVASVALGGGLPVIRSLNLAFNTIGDDGLSALSKACERGAMPLLESLDVSSNGEVGDAGVAALATACGSGAFANLDSLYLSDNDIGNAGVEALAAACGTGALPLIELLYLGRNRIGDGGLDALAAAYTSGGLQALRSLSLSDNGVGNASVQALASAMGKSQLETLHLDANRVSDGGVEALASHGFAKLKTLGLAKNAIAVEALARVLQPGGGRFKGLAELAVGPDLAGHQPLVEACEKRKISLS